MSVSSVAQPKYSINTAPDLWRLQEAMVSRFHTSQAAQMRKLPAPLQRRDLQQSKELKVKVHQVHQKVMNEPDPSMKFWFAGNKSNSQQHKAIQRKQTQSSSLIGKPIIPTQQNKSNFLGCMENSNDPCAERIQLADFR